MSKTRLIGGLLLASIVGYAGVRYVSGDGWIPKWAPDPWRWGLPPYPHAPWPAEAPDVPAIPNIEPALQK